LISYDGAVTRIGDALKGAAAVTAVISLLLAANQVTGLVQTFRVHHKEFSEAIAVGKQELGRGDYPAAFESFTHAAELDPIDHGAQNLKAQAAMLWLENVQGGTKSFTEIANSLLPVLDKALSNSKGPAAADLTAHIGWANFLRYRDGARGGISIEDSYGQALRLDPHNVYAHAMWGHWILWQHGEVSVAAEHFAAALATGRAHLYVRSLQISALLNSAGDAEDTELLLVANEMRLNGESMEPQLRQSVFEQTFESRLDDPDKLAEILKTLKREDAEATYDWLSSAKETNEAATIKRRKRDFMIAFLEEISGDHADALSRYEALQEELRGSRNSPRVPGLDQALKRLIAEKAGSVATNHGRPSL
jgi:hypothetical protein